MTSPAISMQNLDAPISRSNDNRIATLTLNRAARFNTLSVECIASMQAHLSDIAVDDAIQVVIIAAKGKAFSSGHDLKDMQANRNKKYYDQLLADCARMMQSIVGLPQPVIAKVQGIATAAGCQLVASCDLAIAARSARFATSGINYGVFCATPAVAVGRTIGRKHALEMLFTGDFLSADRAAEIGLVNHAVDDDKLDEAVRVLAEKIAAKAPASLRIGKASFNRQIHQPLDAAYRSASDDMVCNLLTDDAREGLLAFTEKRQPEWGAK